MEQKLLELIENINPENTILADTPFLIYHLEDIRPYSDVTSEIMDSVGEKNSRIFLSLISYTEILVGILNQKKLEAEKTFKDFIKSNPSLEILDFNYEISETAAGIRSENNLRLADSIIVAAAIKAGVKFLITNDAGFFKVKNKDIKIIMLDDLIKK
ncbi:MAG: PIN domain-containing protein [Actinobacteria bacterium]|nr:PIN domain-containing protein [Actinomycetota bacterium]